MNLMGSRASTIWPFLSSDENRQWHQLSQRHQQALQALRQQGADGNMELNLLKQQLVEICALHRFQQKGRASRF